MLYIIVRNKTNDIIAKDVYSGDDAKNRFLIAQRDNTLVYEEVSQEMFDAIIVSKVINNSAWNTAKSNNVALPFLGKLLGLE